MANPIAGRKLNRPHYHAWLMASTGRIFYRTRPHHTRQGAHQWAQRREPDAAKRVVRECWEPPCQPKD